MNSKNEPPIGHLAAWGADENVPRCRTCIFYIHNPRDQLVPADVGSTDPAGDWKPKPGFRSHTIDGDCARDPERVFVYAADHHFCGHHPTHAAVHGLEISRLATRFAQMVSGQGLVVPGKGIIR